MQHCLIWAMECVRAGVAAGWPVVSELGDHWSAALGQTDEPRRAELSSEHRTTEFEAMLRHAVAKAQAKPLDELHKLHDDIAGIPMHPAPPETTGQPELENTPFWIDWSAFIKRESEDRRWLVEGFWPWGRSVALWAAAKAGKSELALWCAAKLALGEHPWTGKAVPPIDVAYFDYEMTADDLEKEPAWPCSTSIPSGSSTCTTPSIRRSTPSTPRPAAPS